MKLFLVATLALAASPALAAGEHETTDPNGFGRYKNEPLQASGRTLVILNGRRLADDPVEIIGRDEPIALGLDAPERGATGSELHCGEAGLIEPVYRDCDARPRSYYETRPLPAPLPSELPVPPSPESPTAEKLIEALSRIGNVRSGAK